MKRYTLLILALLLTASLATGCRRKNTTPTTVPTTMATTAPTTEATTRPTTAPTTTPTEASTMPSTEASTMPENESAGQESTGQENAPRSMPRGF